MRGHGLVILSKTWLNETHRQDEQELQDMEHEKLSSYDV